MGGLLLTLLEMDFGFYIEINVEKHMEFVLLFGDGKEGYSRKLGI